MTGSLRASLVNRNGILKIEALDYEVRAHTGFLPDVAIMKRKVEQKIPEELLEEIRKRIREEEKVKIKWEKEEGNEHDGSNKQKVDQKSSKSNANTPTSGNSKKSDQDENQGQEQDGVKDRDLGNSFKEEDSSSSPNHHTILVDQTFLPESPVNEYGITLRAMRCLEVSTQLLFPLGSDLARTSGTETKKHAHRSSLPAVCSIYPILDNGKCLSTERSDRSFSL